VYISQKDVSKKGHDILTTVAAIRFWDSHAPYYKKTNSSTNDNPKKRFISSLFWHSGESPPEERYVGRLQFGTISFPNSSVYCSEQGLLGITYRRRKKNSAERG
jgi:hypothetical protein